MTPERRLPPWWRRRSRSERSLATRCCVLGCELCIHVPCSVVCPVGLIHLFHFSFESYMSCLYTRCMHLHILQARRAACVLCAGERRTRGSVGALLNEMDGRRQALWVGAVQECVMRGRRRWRCGCGVWA